MFTCKFRVSAMQSGAGELIVSASADASVQLWSPNSHNPAEQHKLTHMDQVCCVPSYRTADMMYH